jgi:hypothetical protein
VPDYTAFSKIFKAANNAPTSGGALPPIPDKPKIAGYLPAPHEARFISSSEEAAKKLTPTVKAESIKNELLKRGAKPVELEYAGIDEFAANNAGQRVSANDIHQKLTQDGPLGKLWRVDQQPRAESVKAGVAREDVGTVKDTGPYLANPREPFNPQAAYPDTVYHQYTEQGRQGDYSGYREVLFDDPQNAGTAFGFGGGQPINAHDSSYWVRYHNNPDSIAVQNIQSDVGQKWTKAQEGYKKAISAQKNAEFEPPVVTDEMIERYGPVPSVSEIADVRLKIQDLRREYGEDLENLPMDGEGYYESLMETLNHPAVAHLNDPIAPAEVSPIAKDDNWKNFLARQVILEAAREGKPISLPTGANAHAVEMMPENAAKHFYEKDMPERIRKIIKGFDPKEGARVEVVDAPPSLAGPGARLFGRKLHDDDANALMDSLWSAIEHGYEAADKASGQGGRFSHEAINSLQHLRNGLNKAWEGEDAYDISGYANDLDRWVRGSAALDPEVAKQLQGVMSHLYLAKERGQKMPVRSWEDPPEVADTVSGGRRPGTWIHMSPVARREILEKGMPIMSIGAGALLSGLNDQSNDR